MSQDYAPAQWIPTDHFWSGRSGHTPRWIIVHGTAGGNSAEAVGRYFQTDDPPTSTHYMIGLQGEVIQCVRETDSAWGNGIVTQGADPWWTPKVNPNFLTFSIEHVKPDTDNRSQITEAQKAASFALIKHLCEKYNIPTRQADASGGITGHYSIDPVNRAHCPGPYPFDELFAYLGGGGKQVGVPQGWHDDGATLTAPNGMKVVLGFRWYILTHPWEADNWPIETEHYAKVIDITNPGLGSGTVQHFRKSILAWQESTGDLVELWSGATALAWEQRAQSTVAAKSAPAASASATTNATTSAARVAVPVGAMVSATAATIASSAATGEAGSARLNYVPSSRPAPSRASTNVSSDPVSQRISSLEQQIQALIQGLDGNPKVRKVARDIEGEAGTLVPSLGRKKVRRNIFSNPRSLVRWVLMIVGLLFSDIVAWFISSFAHHSTSLPLPFLTVGSLVTGLAFLSALRLPLR